MKPLRASLHLASSLFLLPAASHATEYTWSGPAAGTWDISNTNWLTTDSDPWDAINGFLNTAIFDTTDFAASVSGTVFTNAIQFNTAGSLGNGTITLGGTTPSLTTNATASIGSVLAGSAGLSKAGTGTLTLTGANTYTGGTTINQGTLRIGNGTVNGTYHGTYSVAAGATLQFAQGSYAALPWTAVSGAGTLAIGGANVDRQNSPTNLGTGFTGTLQIESGRVLSGTAGTTLGNAITVVVKSGSQFAMWNSGGQTFSQNFEIEGTGWGEASYPAALRLANSGTLTLNGAIHLTGSAGIIGRGNSTNHLNGDITESGGSRTLNFGGASNGTHATYSLTGSNSYTGGTIITSGWLVLGSGGAVGSTGIISMNGGTLRFTAANITDYSSRLKIEDGRTATFDTNGQNVTFTNTLALGTGKTGAITKAGTGTLTLSAANSHTGTTTVTSGALNLSHALAVQASTLSLGTDASSGVVFDQSVSGNAFTFGGLAGGSGKTLALQNNASTPTSIDLTVGGNNASNTFSGTLSGPGSLTKTGTGDLTLNGTNSFTGVLAIHQGRLSANTSGNGGLAVNTAGRITVGNGGQFLGFTGTYTPNFEIAGNNGWNETGYPGAIRLAASATANFSGNILLTEDATLMAQRGSTMNLTGAISGTGSLRFHVGDPAGSSGTIHVTPAIPTRNDYASTTIAGSGTGGAVVAGNPYAFSTGGLTVQNSSLRLNGYNFTFANLVGTGGQIGNYGADNCMLTIGTDGTDTASSTTMVDGGTGKLGLEKTGGGILALNGNNTYTGNTLVSAGTLLVNGSLGASAVSVSSSGTVGGTGTIGGNLQLDSGAVLNIVNIDNPLTIAGAVTFGGFGFTNIHGWDYATAANGTYTLLVGTAVDLTNVSNVGLANALDLGSGRSAYFQNGSLQVVIIPEPGTALIGSLGLLALLRRRRF